MFEELEKLKSVELRIFIAFIEVCCKLNLKYYILGGTLLGAVRHGGFIPWDDDIDVGMPRADYDLFLSEGQALLPREYFIQHADNEAGYRHNFAKVRDSNTTFIEASMKDHPIHHGVYIDVFPLDYYPDGKLGRLRVDQGNRILEAKIWRRRNPSPWKRLILSCIPMTDRCAVRKRERLFRSAKCGKMIANYNGAWGKKEIVPADWYGEGCTLRFEGLAVSAPAQYDKWLTQVYGDYMQLPPVEKRITHDFKAYYEK